MSGVYSSLPEKVWNHGFEPISEKEAFTIFTCRYEQILHDVYHWFLESQNLPTIAVRFDFKDVSSEHAYFWADKKMLVVNVRAIMTAYGDEEYLTYVMLETFFHELFHYWQSVNYGLPKMKALNLMFNGGAYWLYQRNPLEIEARSFATSAVKQYLAKFGEDTDL